jgi:hypothetical protein
MFQLERHPDTLEALTEALFQTRGDMIAACQMLKVRYRHVVAWMQADADTAQALKEAQKQGWMRLENAAMQRAVEGVPKGVYYKGKCVGVETVYSDGLLSQMLKARVPGYGEDGGHSGMTVNVAVMPRANSYEEWTVQRNAALAGGRESTASLAASERVIEGKTINGMPDVL